jgi:NAD(P)-dependent dehydrogenase (short-subunit alcohol dehydrogenase family)
LRSIYVFRQRKGKTMPLAHPDDAQTALVTGSGSGIGRALALEAAARGYRLALIDSDAAALAETARQAQATGAAVAAVCADVRKRDALAAACDRVLADAAAVALVFVNAGVLRAGPLWTMSVEAVDLVLDVNLKGAINTLAAVTPRLLVQESVSRIVVTASVGALTAAPELGVYSASKHALWALCESYQRDLRAVDAPIEVTLLCPGAVATALADHEGSMAQTLRERMAGPTALSPQALALRTFEALSAGGFWLFPQPDYLAPIRRRLQRVIDLQDPVAGR